MNTKKILCIVTLLLMTLITACEVVQTAEIISTEDPEGQEEVALPDVSQDENENQEALPLLADVEPPLGSQTLITRENAHQLAQIQYLGKGIINDIAWSPSGSPIALATVTGIYLIDPKTNEEVHFTTTPSNHIDFLPGGSVFASVEESQVILRDLTNECEPLILGDQIEDAAEIAFSPSGDTVAIASTDGTIIIKNRVSEELLSTLTKPETFFYHLAFSQDGQTLITNAYSQKTDRSDVIIWDVDMGVEVITASEIRGSTAAVSPQSELIVAGGGPEITLRLLDFDGQVQSVLDGEPKSVFDLAFSPDGKILASITLNDSEESWTVTSLKLWDTASGELLHTLDDAGEYRYISFSPDNTQVAAAAFDQAKLWDVESGQEIGIITDQPDALEKVEYGTGGVNDFAWSPDGNTLAMATFKGIDLVNLQTQKETHFKIEKEVYYNFGHIITFSSDGSLLAVSYGKGVNIYDVKSQEKLFTLNDFDDMGAFGIAFNPDNTWLATGWGNPWGAPGGLKIWDVSTGTLLHELSRKIKIDSIFDLTFNEDGNLMAGISGTGKVHIWDIETLQVVKRFQATGGYGYAVAFSPDGKVLAVGGAATFDDATICLRLFDLETEEILFDLQGHEDWYVGSIAFNADGGVLASASWDGTVRLWDTQNGEQLAKLDVPGATSVAFNPEGTLLATGGNSDVLRLWSVSEPNPGIEGTSPNTTIETSIIPASSLGEDFRPGRWSSDGRYIYFTNQGPMDEPGPDQAFQTLTFLDAQSGEICTSFQEIVNFSYNPWSETMIPERPLIDDRAFWMNDNRLLYLSQDGELLAITPCSDFVEDLSDTLPESISAFHYGASHDNSQLLLKGETGTWIFTPSTGRSVKVAIPESFSDEESHFAWSPWEAKLVSSRVESGDGGLKIIIETIDPVTGDSEIIAEFPVVNEGGSWHHSIGGFLSWTTKNQIFLHYLDNYHEKEKLIDLRSRPVEITHVFTDLFGIEPPSLDSELTLFGETNTTGEEDYYLSIGSGLFPDGQLYLYSAKTGLVETYPLDLAKLLIFPDGNMLFGDTYNETPEDMLLQIIQIDTDRAPYTLEINGEIPGQFIHGKVIMVDDDQHLLVATDQCISLISLENGEMLQNWVLENHDQYNDFLLSPSPDGNTVIIYAAQIDENEDWWSSQYGAIYLLNLDS